MVTLNRSIHPAHSAVNMAVKAGKLTRPTKCERCGKGRREIIAHHHKGYAKKNWLNVQWLCHSCHKFAHTGLDVAGRSPKVVTFVNGGIYTRLRKEAFRAGVTMSALLRGIVTAHVEFPQTMPAKMSLGDK